MKKFLSAGLFLAFTLLLTNCKKDTDDNTKLGIFGPDGTWKATINGVAHEGAFSGGVYQDGKILTLSLDQDANANERITVQLIESPNTIKQGNTYSFNGSYRKDGIIYEIYSPDLGTITLTKFDEVNQLISGTLSFKARDSFSSPVDEIQVTNTEFVNLSYIVD